MASSNPFRVGSQGWGMLIHQNHAAGEENGSIMVAMFVSLCLASKKPSEREFFVPAGTDLGVKLLTPICLRAGTKTYPSVDFLRRNSTFFLISATQPQPTNNTTMVSRSPLWWHGLYR